MRFSEDFLSELRSRIDIEELVSKYTDIKHPGSRNPVALCPFHAEKTPSFVIYRNTQSYYCFGCGAGGDAITFVKNIERLDYVDAVRFLCQKAGMKMPLDSQDDEYNRIRRRCYEANREAARFFYHTLNSPEGAAAGQYLEKRGIEGKTVRHFGLGCAPAFWDALIKHMKGRGFSEAELVQFNLAKRTRSGAVIDAFRNRLIFPIMDLRGNVVAFGARVLDGSKPKYINTSDTPVYKKSHALYALNFAKNESSGKLILCEGYMDVIAMHQAGFTNAVAGLGTAFTNEQISLLTRYCTELTLCFDSDEAGKKATRRALDMLSSAPLKLKVMSLEGGKDPDEIIKTKGREEMENIISSAVNNTEFALNGIRERYNLSSEDGKLGFFNEAVEVLSRLSNKIELDIYMSGLSSELGVDKTALAAQVEKRRRSRRYHQNGEQFDYALKSVLGESKINSPNPEKRGNMKAVKAEEIILASLLKHPDYIKRLSGSLTTDIFVTEFNKKYFEDISSRIAAGKSIELFAFDEGAENEDMAYLSYLFAKGNMLADTPEECEQCIKTLIAEKSRRKASDVGRLTSEEYLELFKKKGAESKRKKGV